MYPPWEFCSNFQGLFSIYLPFLSPQNPNTRCAETCGWEHAKGEEHPQAGARRLHLHGISSNGRGREETESACLLCCCYFVNSTASNSAESSAEVSYSSFWPPSLQNQSLLFSRILAWVELNMNLPLIFIKSSIPPWPKLKCSTWSTHIVL